MSVLNTLIMNLKSFLVLVFCFSFSCKTKNYKKSISLIVKEEKLAVENSCGYTGIAASDKVYSFISDKTTESYVDEIMKVEGLPVNFKIKAVDIPDNAFAIIVLEDNQPIRYIMYSQEFFESIKNITKSDYSIKSVLAHEIGHHLCGHTLKNDGSRPLTELEADRFSGFALRRMGANLNEALCAIKSLGSKPASLTHPSTTSRIAAITNGWKAADELYSGAPSVQQAAIQSTQSKNNNITYSICNMENYYLALRNKIMSQDELATANSTDKEAKSLLDARTLVGIIPNKQEFRLLEINGNFLKIETTLAGQNAIGYIPSKVFGKKIYCTM